MHDTGFRLPLRPLPFFTQECLAFNSAPSPTLPSIHMEFVSFSVGIVGARPTNTFWCILKLEMT